MAESINKKLTFEQCYKDIEREIEKRRGRWRLDSISYIDFDDVKMIILNHIYKKWNQYNPDYPLSHWVSRITSNQITNISRNIYGRYKKPCLSCPCAEGSDFSCRIFGTQTEKCPLLLKWAKHKKDKYHLEISSPLEYHVNDASKLITDHLDILKAADIIHEKMKCILKPLEWKYYELIYVKHKTDSYIARIMKFKRTKNNNIKVGFRRIYAIKKRLMDKVKKMLANNEFDIYFN